MRWRSPTPTGSRPRTSSARSAAPRLDAPSQVHRLSQRLAAGPAALGAGAGRLAGAGPASGERELVLPSRLDEALPAARHAADRAGRSATGASEHAPDGPLALVMTYPHYLYLRDLVRPDRHVYFNIDDYALYWPRCADRGRRAGAPGGPRGRPDGLRLAAPRRGAARGGPRGGRADPPPAPRVPRRRRSPSAPGTARPPPPDDLAALPRPLLGYVGTLEDRVDWAAPGPARRGLPARPRSSWSASRRPPTATAPGSADRRRCLALPNVHALGWRPQETIARIQPRLRRLPDPLPGRPPVQPRLLPDQDHGLHGHRAARSSRPTCPSAGSTATCSTSPTTPDDFLDAVAPRPRRRLRRRPGRVRHDWARENTCRRVVERFLDWLPA